VSDNIVFSSSSKSEDTQKLRNRYLTKSRSKRIGKIHIASISCWLHDFQKLTS
jgi:hypothetical protein